MDVRIGVTYSSKELDVEMAGDTDHKKLKKSIEEALASETNVLWLTDKLGRDVAVPVSRIAYIEIGSSASERNIGFG